MIKKNGLKPGKIEDYDKYEENYYTEEMTKTLPNLILAFNSKRRVLKTTGLPSLMKEIAEFIECGPLNSEFRSVEYIQAIEKYASIEQRWGR